MARVSKIPLLDLVSQYKTIQAETEAAVLAVLASGAYIGGETVRSFERQFADYVGVSECVACNSGTDALYLALRSLRIGPGDQVITTPFTFFATAEVISAVGATPVFVDIDPRTFNLDVAQVEAAITAHTRAIIPVHLFGQAVDMTALMQIAQTHQLYVIEDCAQATGAMWANQRVGSIGHIGCFSFYPTKNLGACGDGGAVTTNDPEIAAMVRMLQEHGSKTRYHHDEIGVNSRLDAVQAAVLQIKLRHLDDWNAARTAAALRYHDRLANVPGVVVPYAASGGQSVWNQYTIRVQENGSSGSSADGENRRDRLRQGLQERAIGAMVYYPLPLHLQSVYQSLGYRAGQFPAAEQACQEVLSLPMFPELVEEQQTGVVYAIKEVLSDGASGD